MIKKRWWFQGREDRVGVFEIHERPLRWRKTWYGSNGWIVDWSNGLTTQKY